MTLVERVNRDITQLRQDAAVVAAAMTNVELLFAIKRTPRPSALLTEVVDEAIRRGLVMYEAPSSVKSIGHIGFTRSLEGHIMEVYESYDGDIYWASIHSYLECNGPNKGRRIGRFLCTAAAKDSCLGQMDIQVA